ncbi:MAG: YdeI/OmpD-associated family protein [Xanthomonadaceae bacterium]|nr:YdeI/OmpD-associated family protein [Xanthomonadaceae bacterium]
MAQQTKGARSAGIDAYIERANPVFQPMMESLRDAVHRHCPAVEETLKWSAPSFSYRGRILCGMAAFKQHMSFGYWQHAEVVGADAARDGMGSYGKMRGPADMPKAATLKADIRKAMALIDETASGAAPTKTKPVKKARPTLPVPEDLRSALERQPKALRHFDAFSPSQRREYIEWIVEAKREDTRTRRIAQAVEWLGEGKHRNWKYESC